ncbi:hypothetical protein EAH68_12565 [Corynebacterium hylobatis]|uniref:Uncharacterized protein n=1 Tax=Corynebacterium hylobatis TaxID=1859290 RepID=A0A3R9ZYG5_9CORY|nr:hypothetical protein [Corynebacterium hylobatis]RSZ61602.1 hypothetical protein EAH68_12565 [Corynebacterium hylobatis]
MSLPLLQIATRVVGLGFAVASVFNLTISLPRARQMLNSFADDSWLPPYRRVLRVLLPAAPAVIGSVVAFQAAVAWNLLRGRRVTGALRGAQAFMLGLVPALTWPYWPSNVVLPALLEILVRRVG